VVRGGCGGRVIVLLPSFRAMIVGIVFVQEGLSQNSSIISARHKNRRLPEERRSYLPLRLNQGPDCHHYSAV